MVRAPVSDRALDVALRLEITAESTARQVRHFVVRREPDGNQLRGGQLSDSAAKVGRHEAFETSALLETNDPVLCSDWHESKIENGQEQSERHYNRPSSDESRIARELNSCHDDVDQEDRNCEKVVRRNESPVVA
jgi:hypothetical protein